MGKAFLWYTEEYTSKGSKLYICSKSYFWEIILITRNKQQNTIYRIEPVQCYLKYLNKEKTNAQ